MHRSKRLCSAVVVNLIFQIVLVSVSFGQHVVAEAPVVIDKGVVRSTIVSVAFNKEVISTPRGTRVVDNAQHPIRDSLFFVLLDQLSNRYGPVTIRKKVPDAIWGDTLVVNKRSKKTVRQNDMSQFFSIEFARTVPVDSVLEILQQIPVVKYAEPPMFVEFQYGPNDPSYSSQWHLETIQAPLAWDITRGSSATILCDVEEYALVTMRNMSDFVNQDASNQFLDGYGYNGSNHAIGVLSIMGAATDNGAGLAGVGWRCKLANEAFTDPGSTGQSLADALYRAWDNANADVVNCSFVTKKVVPPSNKLCPYDFPSIEAEISNLVQAGVVVVAAGGNYQDLCPCDPTNYVAYPAWYDEVIGVAGTDQNDQFIPSYNHGAGIDVSAPSESIPVLLESGQVGSASGTSCAAPQVTALVGLILSLNSTLTGTEIANIIKTTCDKVDESSHSYVNGRNDYLGYGRINAYNAVRYTIAHYSTTIGGVGETVLFTDNLTIASGTTLAIRPGTIVRFSSGKALTVYGRLLAQGNSGNRIRFTSTNGSSTWNGILVSGSGANNSIFDYTDIDHVQTYGGSALNVYGATGLSFTNSTISNSSNYSTTGIFLSNAGSPEIAYCTISNCGGYGVSYYNTSGYLYANGIDWNTAGGVAFSYSSPSFGKINFPAYIGNNTIQGGAYAIYAAYNSYPYVGSQYNSYYGYNNLVGGSSARIYATSSCDVMAEANWWGTPYPSPSLFQTYNNSTIDRDPRLYSQVGNLRRIAVGSNEDSIAPEQTQVNALPDTLSPLRKAWEYLALGNEDEAERLFRSVAISSSENVIVDEAIAGLLRIFDLTHDASVLAFCQSPSVAGRMSEGFQGQLLTKVYLAQGSFADAAAHLSSLISRAKGPFLKSALLDMVALAISGELNDAVCDDALGRLEALYGSRDSDLMQARWVRELSRASRAAGSIPTNPKPGMDKTTSVSFELSAAFPNPFNPTTAIRYVLPSPAHVTIVVFNVVGQKVAELLDSEVDAGNHALQFDARNFGSGVYFAQMRVTDELGRLIYSKVNRLILTK